MDRATCDRLKGRHVVAVNSMHHWVPWAEYAFFGDLRWWHRECGQFPDRVRRFKGEWVTIAPEAKRMPGGTVVRKLKRVHLPPGITMHRDSVAMARTSALAAINLCVHLGANRVFLLGVDGGWGANKRAHCHTEHPWPRPPHTWRVKVKEFLTAVTPLALAGVEVFNCNPKSELRVFPSADLDSVLGDKN
jgi:hypothetical protein